MTTSYTYSIFWSLYPQLLRSASHHLSLHSYNTMASFLLWEPGFNQNHQCDDELWAIQLSQAQGTENKWQLNVQPQREHLHHTSLSLRLRDHCVRGVGKCGPTQDGTINSQPWIGERSKELYASPLKYPPQSLVTNWIVIESRHILDCLQAYCWDSGSYSITVFKCERVTGESG